MGFLIQEIRDLPSAQFGCRSLGHGRPEGLYPGSDFALEGERYALALLGVLLG
jgi:hypothetical protein